MILVSDQLLIETVKYHFKRVIMKASDIVVETQSTIIRNIQIGQSLKVMVVGLVAAENFQKTGRDPFFFHHFDQS